MLDIEKELLRLQRRISKLQLLISGDARVTRKKRKGHWVKRYWVNDHYVSYIDIKEKNP